MTLGDGWMDGWMDGCVNEWMNLHKCSETQYFCSFLQYDTTATAKAHTCTLIVDLDLTAYAGCFACCSGHMPGLPKHSPNANLQVYLAITYDKCADHRGSKHFTQNRAYAGTTLIASAR